MYGARKKLYRKKKAVKALRRRGRRVRFIKRVYRRFRRRVEGVVRNLSETKQITVLDTAWTSLGPVYSNAVQKFQLIDPTIITQGTAGLNRVGNKIRITSIEYGFMVEHGSRDYDSFGVENPIWAEWWFVWPLKGVSVATISAAILEDVAVQKN